MEKEKNARPRAWSRPGFDPAMTLNKSPAHLCYQKIYRERYAYPVEEVREGQGKKNPNRESHAGPRLIQCQKRRRPFTERVKGSHREVRTERKNWIYLPKKMRGGKDTPEKKGDLSVCAVGGMRQETISHKTHGRKGAAERKKDHQNKENLVQRWPQEQ